MHSKRLRADLALAFTALIWGGTFVVVKDALADVSTFMYLSVRFALAALVMAIFFWHSLKGLTRSAIWAGVQIGFFMFAGYALQTTGLKYTSPSKAAFITGSSVVIVPILLAIFGRRRVNGWIWVGALAALAGLYFLTIPPEGIAGLNRGDPMVFACAVMFAVHMIVIGRYVEHHSVAALAVVQVATTALLSTLALPLLSGTGVEHPRWVWSGTLIFAVLITSIGSTAFGFSAQTWAQQYTSPTHTAILISLEPVFAAITAWLVAREHLTGRILLGAALILAGILFAELKGGAPAAPESPEPLIKSAV
ncbi:MAG: DMT family transporter [Candidatus Acidiferrales bacterium]